MDEEERHAGIVALLEGNNVESEEEFDEEEPESQSVEEESDAYDEFEEEEETSVEGQTTTMMMSMKWKRGIVFPMTALNKSMIADTPYSLSLKRGKAPLLNCNNGLAKDRLLQSKDRMKKMIFLSLMKPSQMTLLTSNNKPKRCRLS